MKTKRFFLSISAFLLAACVLPAAMMLWARNNNRDVPAEPSEPVQVQPLMPTQLTMTFGTNSKTSRSFVWYSREQASEPVLEWATNSALEDSTRISAAAQAVRKPMAMPITEDTAITEDTPTDLFQTVYYVTQPAVRYDAALSDLQAGQTYYYRVGDTESGTWSSVYSFSLDEDDTAFTFIQVNDSQSMDKNDCDAYNAVLQEAFESFPQASFLLHGGDFVEEGSDEEYWTSLLDHPIVGGITQVPAAGNHDVKSRVDEVTSGDNAILTHYAVQNYPPQDTSYGVYYAITYEHALFVVLNTNETDENGYLLDSQYQWAKETLMNSEARWKILLMHKSVYSTGNHAAEADVIALREQMNTLCKEADVDAVFSGHDHVYNRTPSLVNGTEETVTTQTVEKDGITYSALLDPVGTTFVIAGAAGSKHYEQQDVDIPSAFKTPMTVPAYAAVELENNTLFYRAYAVQDGESVLIDTFAIVKTP